MSTRRSSSSRGKAGSEEERRRALNEADPLDSVEPLDEDQQESIVNELRATAERQAKNARRYFWILYKLIVCIFLFCLIYSYQYPWEMAHQSVFAGLVPLKVFKVYYVAMSVVFIIAGLGISQGILKTRMYLNYFAVAIAVASTIMWAYYFYNIGVTHPSLYWLLFAPGMGIAMAIYVDYDADRTILEVNHLNDLKYSHKGA